MNTASADTTDVDLLVIGSGTGLAAALAAHESGLRVLVVEKTGLVGGSTARSGGAFWIPANPVLAASGATDSAERGLRYLESVVGGTSPHSKLAAYVEHGAATVEMLERTTRMRFMWDEGYSDYHPEEPGGSAAGRSCECEPFDLSVLGADRTLLRGGVMEAPIPMPVTGRDYKWLNLLVRVPSRGLRVAIGRAFQGIGGLLIGRRYAAGGQAIAGGLFDAVRRAGIPIWIDSPLLSLVRSEGRVVGAEIDRAGVRTTVTARHGVVLAAGGFDHDMAWRHAYQSESLAPVSFGAPGNTGDAIKAAMDAGAAVHLMDQAWWFPAIAAAGDGEPVVMLAERSLPGSFIVDRHGRRFVNESEDYMSFGQDVLAREAAGDPVGRMWLVFDKRYRASYLLGGSVFPGQPLPKAWYEAGIAHRAGSWRELAGLIDVPADALEQTGARFNELAGVGVDEDFHRGGSAYDRYYGDPTIAPNPNLRPLDARDLFAVEMVLSDLGTCGGLVTDENARVLDAGGAWIEGLYAIGNTAGNAFGRSYPGAGATIGQGLVFGYIAAHHAAARARADVAAAS